MLIDTKTAFALLVPVVASYAIPQWAEGGVAEPARIALPDNAPGKCAGAYVDAFNSGDAAKMRAFEETYRAKSALQTRTIEDRLKQYDKMKGDWGKLEIRKVASAKETDITLLVHIANEDSLFEFQFVLEPEKPFGLDHIKIMGPVTLEDAGAMSQPLTPELRATTVESTAKTLEENYVFPEVGAKMAVALRENLKSKKYDSETTAGDLARRLTDDLRAICKDRHLTVSAAALPDEKEGGPMRRRGTPDDARRENYAFRKVEVLPSNIGYVKFDEFHPSDGAKQVAAGAMAFLANSDALIFDLRENGGGSPEMIKFLSNYLFDKPTHLNSFYDRSSNKTEEWWTESTIEGRRFANDLPVYVLTSKYTFSGAEEFAYNLQNLKRATIIGETTGGGAHPVNSMRINDRFSMMVPYARAMNPITQTNWEGVGVKPHIEVSAADALNRAKEEIAKKIGERKVIVTNPK